MPTERLIAPTADDIERIGRATLASIPDELRRHVRDVPIIVQDLAEDEILDDMGIESPYDLLGLYSGVSLEQKLSNHVSHDIDRIFLYRGAILFYWIETGEPLDEVVRHVLIHEIGHHFGLSDDDMEAIEAAAD